MKTVKRKKSLKKEEKELFEKENRLIEKVMSKEGVPREEAVAKLESALIENGLGDRYLIGFHKRHNYVRCFHNGKRDSCGGFIFDGTCQQCGQDFCSLCGIHR